MQWYTTFSLPLIIDSIIREEQCIQINKSMQRSRVGSFNVLSVRGCNRPHADHALTPINHATSSQVKDLLVPLVTAPKESITSITLFSHNSVLSSLL